MKDCKNKNIGKVLWFDVKKGYGFIKRDAGSDVFVHYSKIKANDGEFRLLQEGDEVEFEIFLADRGKGSHRPQAKNVSLIGGDDEVLPEERDNTVGGYVDRSKKDQIQDNGRTN